MEIKLFTDEELKNVFDTCTSTMNILELLGYEPYNMRWTFCKELLNTYANLINVNIEDYKRLNLEHKKYKKEHPVCKTCGKDLTYRQYKSKQCFCSSSCAAIYNNLHRVLSKKKKSIFAKELSIRTNLVYKGKPNYILNTDLINQGKILNNKNIPYKEHYMDITKLGIHICQVCGKEFIPSITLKGNISKATTCSDECHILLKQKVSKISINNIIQDGRHKGWITRNITSYPEKFWIKVLNNNHIDFIREFAVKQESGYNYFLDFLIEYRGHKIDLEIDGKQHKYRKEHDKERDEYLLSLNYLIYRIDWNNINTENGKLLMKEKIDNFLNWFNNLS